VCSSDLWSKSHKNKSTIEEYLTKFNPEDYWIYKRTGKQKLVSIEELMDMEYSSYVFFHKSTYNPDYIQQWIDFITVQFIVKPLPPFPPTKIIVRR
jgi:hypothetical protein